MTSGGTRATFTRLVRPGPSNPAAPRAGAHTHTQRRALFLARGTRTEHFIFLGQHAQLGPFFITVIREDIAKTAAPKKTDTAAPLNPTPPIATGYSQLRAMIWLRTVRPPEAGQADGRCALV